MTANRRIEELYKQYGGDVGRVAKELGFGPVEDKTGSPGALPQQARERELPDDVGNPNLRRFMVSARHCSQIFWPAKDQAKIKEAQDSYADGYSEIFQEKTRCGWYILYCKPRRKRHPHYRDWFRIQEEG